VPTVDILKGRGAASGTTVVNVELMDADDGIEDETTSRDDMPFLKSSSYDATWYENGCLSYSTTLPPVSAPKVVERTACLTEEACDTIRQSKNIDQFSAGDYPSKGCFTKNGIVFWGRGGSVEDRSTEEMPGVQMRVWCEKEVLEPDDGTGDDNGDGGDGDGDGDSETTTTACTTPSACDRKRLELGMTKFSTGDYPSKGCFSKNGKAYWGSDGTETMQDISTVDLPGVQERIWCDGMNSGEDNNGGVKKNGQCEIGPNANPSMACDGGGAAGGELFCQLDTGVCNSRIGVHEGTCVATPELCAEEYNPVCACDGIKTYSNACKAHSAGVSISRTGKCSQDDDTKPNIVTVDTACLTEEECNSKRQEMNIESFFVGEYPTKGCFIKNERAYFSTGGSVVEMEREDLPGVQERIWCTKEVEEEEEESQLRQSDGTTETSTQFESDEKMAMSSSSFSLRPSLFLLGSSFFHSVLSSVPKSTDQISASSPLRSSSSSSRALVDTCVYNVEVLLFGCNESFESARIEVSAPTARVINSETTNQSSETLSVNEIEKLEDGTVVYTQDTRHTATLVFPEEQSDSIDVSGDGGDLDRYVEVPPLADEGKCAVIVCGRPFVDSKGNSLLASPFSSGECGVGGGIGVSSWLGEATLQAPVVAIESNSTSHQNELGEEWTRSALGEHASVASFAAFSIALMSNQAPSHLVEDSLKAALDEVRHTKTSFDIASKLLGKELGPGPLPPSSHEFHHDLTALALSVAKEGCVDETLSALAAAADVALIDEVLKHGGAAKGTTKYSGVDTELLIWIRNELHTISVDESNHSALAWRTLNWVCAVDTDACDAAKRSVLDKEKLNKAFQLRFSRFPHGNPELMERMLAAWVSIYTTQNVLHSSVEPNDVLGPTCGYDVVDEENRNDLPEESLLSLLVENVSRSAQVECRIRAVMA